MKAALSLAVSLRVDAEATSWASYPPRKGVSHAAALYERQHGQQPRRPQFHAYFQPRHTVEGAKSGACRRRQKKTPIYNRNLPRSAGKRKKGSVRFFSHGLPYCSVSPAVGCFGKRGLLPWFGAGRVRHEVAAHIPSRAVNHVKVAVLNLVRHISDALGKSFPVLQQQSSAPKATISCRLRDSRQQQQQ